MLLRRAILAPLLALLPLFASGEPAQDLSQQLQKAVQNSAKDLGPLEPWQKRLFEEEALPEYQRFIRDYKPTSSGLSVDVDLDNLKNYLRFYAPKSLQGNTVVVVFLKPEPTCSKCMESLDEIHKLLDRRMALRGFSPFWVSSDEMGYRGLSGKPLTEKVSDLTRSRGAAASLVLEWMPAAVDDIEQAQEEDPRYLIRSYFAIKGFPENNGQLELLTTDSFATAAARLLTDAFTEIGSNLEHAVAENDPNQQEILLDVTGIGDFNSYSTVKNKIQDKLKDVVVDEKAIARGKAVFTLRGKPVDQIKAELARLSLNEDGVTIQVEVR